MTIGTIDTIHTSNCIHEFYKFFLKFRSSCLQITEVRGQGKGQRWSGREDNNLLTAY